MTQDVMSDLRDPGLGFAQVLPDYRLRFPRDHQPHRDYRIEWWYLTANLKDQSGRDWGIQWTLFRQALSSEPASEDWSSNQIWMAHAAITTPEGHFHEQRFARGGIGQAGVSNSDGDDAFSAWLDDWQWRSEDASGFPASLNFSVGERQVSLVLEATNEIVLNGVDGYSQKSVEGQASYYYSQPHIQLRGKVVQGAESIPLSGVGWLDREWSSQALASNQQGWDWFSLHLDDGHKLMIYQLRHADGQHWRSGTWIDPEGRVYPLSQGSIRLGSTRSAEIEVGDNQTRQLPLDWRLTLLDQNRSLVVKPLYDQQWMDTRLPYWEGVVLVEDAEGQSHGVGYMELTGY